MTEKITTTFNAEPGIDALIAGLGSIADAVTLLIPEMSNEHLLAARAVIGNASLDLDKETWRRGLKDGDA